jgi:amino acid transporter
MEPLTGLGPYSWISSFLGPWGIDFVVAAWSVALVETIAIPLSQCTVLNGDPEDPRNVAHVTPYTDNPDGLASEDRSTIYHKSAFTLFLLTLVIPSLWTSTIPNLHKHHHIIRAGMRPPRDSPSA